MPIENTYRMGGIGFAQAQHIAKCMQLPAAASFPVAFFDEIWHTKGWRAEGARQP